MAVAPDGSYYLATHGDVNFSGRVRRVSRPLPLGQGGNGLIPSRDGKQAYEFDADGPAPADARRPYRRHVVPFSYDGAGRLVSITDADGNTTHRRTQWAAQRRRSWPRAASAPS